MGLQNVVPWGRSLSEYQKMFSLSEIDLHKCILGRGDSQLSVVPGSKVKNHGADLRIKSNCHGQSPIVNMLIM